MRLQLLERAGEVEERLGAGAHGDERVVGDGAEVGGHVTGHLGAAVHAADATGGEHRDAGGVGQGQRRRHRRGAVRPRRATATARSRSAALRAGPQMRSCSLGVDAHPGDAVEHGREGGHGAGRPHRGDAALERFGVGRLGQAEVGEDRRLERHDRRAVGQGVGHLGVHEWGERHAGILPGRSAAAEGPGRAAEGRDQAIVPVRRPCPRAAPAAARSARHRRPRRSRPAP